MAKRQAVRHWPRFLARSACLQAPQRAQTGKIVRMQHVGDTMQAQGIRHHQAAVPTSPRKTLYDMRVTRRMTIHEISGALHCSSAWIRQRLVKCRIATQSELAKEDNGRVDHVRNGVQGQAKKFIVPSKKQLDEMRSSGLSWDKIGGIMGCDAETAYKLACLRRQSLTSGKCSVTLVRKTWVFPGLKACLSGSTSPIRILPSGLTNRRPQDPFY